MSVHRRSQSFEGQQESPIVHRVAPSHSLDVAFEVKDLWGELKNNLDKQYGPSSEEESRKQAVEENDLDDSSMLSLSNYFLDKGVIDEIKLCHDSWFKKKLSSQLAKCTISERRMKRKLSEMWKKSHNMVMQ